MLHYDPFCDNQQPRSTTKEDLADKGSLEDSLSSHKNKTEESDSLSICAGVKDPPPYGGQVEDLKGS